MKVFIQIFARTLQIQVTLNKLEKVFIYINWGDEPPGAELTADSKYITKII